MPLSYRAAYPALPPRPRPRQRPHIYDLMRPNIPPGPGGVPVDVQVRMAKEKYDLQRFFDALTRDAQLKRFYEGLNAQQRQAESRQAQQKRVQAQQKRIDSIMKRSVNARRMITDEMATERNRKLSSANRFLRYGLDPATRTVANARMGAAEVTERNKKDNSLLGRAMNVAKSTPGLSLIPTALRVADVGRRGVYSGAVEAGDALREAAGKGPSALGQRGNGRQTGFSWEDFKRNTLDEDKSIGFGDAYQEAIETAGVEDTPLGNIWTRRVVGLAGDIAIDPLTYVPVGLAASGLSRPTQRVARRAMGGSSHIPVGVRRSQARIARDQFLTNTRRGRALESELMRAVAARPGDAGELARRLPGLAPTTARDIASASTKQEAQAIAARAIRTGDYIPDVSLRRQALLATTGRGLKAAGGLGLGRRVVRESQGLFDVGGKARRMANKTKRPVAATVTTGTGAARRATVKAGLHRAGIRSGDAREAVAAAALGMNTWDRVLRLLGDADTLPSTVADVVEATVEKFIPKGSGADFSQKMAELDIDDKVQQALLEAETLVATARGDFGDDVSRQVLTELGVGYARPQNADINTLLRRAGNRAGLTVPSPSIKKVSDGTIRKLRSRIEKDVADEVLKRELRAGLATVKKGKAGVRQLKAAAKSISLAADDAVAADALGMLKRYGDILEDRVDLVGGARVGLGQRINPARSLGLVINSLTDTIPHHQLRFLSTENAELALQERVKAFDSYLGALHVEEGMRSWYRQAVADVATEADLYKVVDDVFAAMANAEGVPPEVLSALLRSTQAEARTMGFKAGQEAGNLLHEVQNLSQLTETVALPNPDDVRRTLRELREAMDDPNRAQEVYRYVRDVAGSTVGAIKPPFLWLHRTWKFLIVTNLYMPVVGGYVGFAGTEGDLEDRLKGGFQWAALGALAPSRYITRVAVIEETARRLLLRGFTPTEFIPGLAKWSSRRGVERPMVSAHLLKSGDPTGNWVRYEMMDRATGEFEAIALADTDGVFAKLGRKQSRYLDSYHRIVNYEINDSNGALDRILLAHRAGYMTRADAEKWFKTFLDSDDGKLWWRRWKGALGGPATPGEAFQRQLKFIEDYVPADIARVRLPAFDADFQEVPRSLLKGAVKRGEAPAFIHAEKTWTIPRGKTFFKDVGLIRNQITDKLIFGGPTRAMQRRPLARAIYKQEYVDLINAGATPKRAQELADLRAINITNEVMFNQNNESRFAAKVDIVFPFQQPREELMRVWLPLAFNNKIRTIQLTSLGARALEAGVSNGTFYEYTNPFTGEKEWRAKIPGSATLSRALGGVNAEFDFGLRDVFFLAQDNMGSTLGVPSPGGPAFSVIARNYFNAFPEHYDSMPAAVRDYLFPFGVSGELMRNEPNRLWMGMMGTPPPWEFASEFEQKNEYNKVQIQMFLHLRYEHFKQTGEWKDPSQVEVEEATKAFFQTQALIGAVWPAPSRAIQPWQELVDKAKQDYVDAKTGEFDYYAFINDHPNMAPFITTRGEYVGPNDFKHWSRSDEERAHDSVKHWERTRSLKDFRAELEHNRLTSEAWEERNIIPFRHPDWEMDEAYIRWEEKWLKKLPEVVNQSRNNYFRDRDLNRIMHMADGPAKDRAVDGWRKRYDVKSIQSYRHHAERLSREGWEVNYWNYSRPTDVVVAEVKSLVRRGASEDAAVSGLQPAEQYKFWRDKQADLVFEEGEDDPQVILNLHYRYSNRVNDLYKKYPKLATGGHKTGVEKHIEKWRGDTRTQINAIHSEISTVTARYEELKAAGKEWSPEGKALYEKRSTLYDMIRALKDKQFQELPGILEYFDDMMAVTALMRDGKPTRRSEAALAAMGQRPLGYGGFIPSNEERGVLKMSKEVREAYTQKLIDQLSLPAVKGQKGKLYWEWLTDFQRDWLSRNLPADMVNEWKKVGPEDAAPRPPGQGGGGTGNVELDWAYEQFRKYSKRPDGAQPPAAYQGYLALPREDKAARRAFIDAHPEVKAWLESGPMSNMPRHIAQEVTNIMIRAGKWEGVVNNDAPGGASSNPELAWAYEMFKQHSKRPEGAKAPATYKEYLALPANPVVRNDFLKKHPEVGAWIAAGPMANMPEHLRYIVQNIMVKYGKWEGEIVPDAAINDLAFAREQLRRWNLRGKMSRPEAYDFWLQMPSGVEKAQYLKAHPEIEEWLKLGPMSNMPDAYQDVVRDIMTRYGEWTTETDGLGKVISDYYSTPAYAREQYLEDHPELIAYWTAIRTPEERRIGVMVDQYYSIQDPNAQRAYLIIHPELKDHFVQKRTERYERFLTHVAIYMGGHPEMFERYLERQNDVMNDLLLRYAEPPLLREVKQLRDTRTTERQRIRG